MPTVVTRLRLQRPLEDLATVFDMAGVAFRVARHPESGGAVVVSEEPEVGVRMHPSKGPDYHLELAGADTSALESLASGLALALKADGIDFRMQLVDDAGALVRDVEAAPPDVDADGH